MDVVDARSEGEFVGVRDSELVDVAVVVAVWEKVGYADGRRSDVTTGADALAVATPSPGKKEYTNATPSMVAFHTDGAVGSSPSTATVAPPSCVIWQSSHQSSPRLYTSMRTMAAVHGSVSRSHWGALAEQGSDADQNTLPSVRG